MGIKYVVQDVDSYIDNFCNFLMVGNETQHFKNKIVQQFEQHSQSSHPHPCNVLTKQIKPQLPP